MKKKLWILLAVLALFVFAFSACQSGKYPFTKLSGGPAATDPVRSNGGSYVEKGDWSYFVNGVEQYSATNKWSETDERVGMLVRVKTAELGSDEAKIEMVVPLLVFANTKDTFGFWIFGDKIYYSTPNSEKNVSGVVQSEKLDIMSVNLDGTGTKRLHTFDSNSTDFMYVEKTDGVYIVYVNADNELRVIDTAVSKNNETTISENIGTYIFDRDEQTAYYTVTQIETKDDDTEITLNYNILYKYKAGSDAVEIKTGKNNAPATDHDHEAMTIVYAADEYVWFTVKNGHTDRNNDLGLWKAKSSTEIEKISNISYSAFIPYKNAEGENVLLVSESSGVWKLTFDSNEDLYPAFSNPDKTVMLYSAGDTVRLEYLSNGNKFLFYSINGAVYRLDVTEGLQTAVQVSDLDAVAANEWMPIEIIEKSIDEIWIIYNGAGIEEEKEEYIFRTIYDDSEKDEDDKRKTVCISKIIEEEE